MLTLIALLIACGDKEDDTSSEVTEEVEEGQDTADEEDTSESEDTAEEEDTAS